jgi:hypothetical protein
LAVLGCTAEQRAPEKGERTHRRRRYRLKLRKVGFGFDIARAKILAGELADEETLAKLKARR